MKKTKQFIESIHSDILYWDNQNQRTSKEKMEGLAFSILCMLDGMSGSFDGSISDLLKEDNFMIHDMFYKEKQ